MKINLLPFVGSLHFVNEQLDGWMDGWMNRSIDQSIDGSLEIHYKPTEVENHPAVH